MQTVTRMCPYCDVTALFELLQQNNINLMAYLTKEKRSANHVKEVYRGPYLYAGLYRCQHCNGVVYLLLQDKMVNIEGAAYPLGEKIVIEMYPKRLPKVDPAIPPKIAEDYIEAVKCFEAGSAKGAAVLCRRSLQNIMLDKGAKGENLYEQLNELAKRRVITPDLAELGHTIRLFGNVGAHPSSDGLDEVSLKEASEILAFTEQLFMSLYVLPSRVQALRNRKKQS